MNTNNSHIAKRLELYFDWYDFQNVVWEIRSNEWDKHIIKIYDKKGRLLHGWFLQGINYK